MDPDAEHIQPSEEPCCGTAKDFHLVCTVPESLKGHFTILLSHLLQNGGDMVRPVNSMNMGPLPHSIFYEVP